MKPEIVNLKEAENGAEKFGLSPGLEARFTSGLSYDDEVVEVKQWDAVRVPAETMRNFEAAPDGAEIVVFGAPRTPPGDAELTHGWWND